jgi:hypothetical protein
MPPPEYAEVFDLAPLPFGARSAAGVVASLAGDLERAGGDLEVVAGAVVDRIVAHQNDPASEVGRLWSLYRSAYTRAELEQLARATFRAAGLGGP